MKYTKKDLLKLYTNLVRARTFQNLAVKMLTEGKVPADGTWLEERTLDACEASFTELIDNAPQTAKIILHP